MLKRTVELGRLSKLIYRTVNILERVDKISILNMLTFELLRFLADLSAGLTGSVAAAGGEDCCDCETWNKTFNNMKVKLCSRELLRWDPIKDDFQVCHCLSKICKIFNIKSAHLGTAAFFSRLVCWLWWVCSSRSSLNWELSLQYFWWARDKNQSQNLNILPAT